MSPLAAVKTPVNAEAVKNISHMLEMAKSGELQQYACAYICQDGMMGNSLSLPKNALVHRLIGAVAYVSHRLLCEQDACETLQPTTPIPDGDAPT